MKKRGTGELCAIGLTLNGLGLLFIIIGAAEGIIAVLIVGIVSVIIGTVFLSIYIKRYFDKVKVGRAVEEAKKESEYERQRQERDLQQAALKAKLKAEQERRAAETIKASEEIEEDDEEYEDDEDEIEEEDDEDESDDETDDDGENLEGAELEAYIEEENLRILQEHGDMETGRVTEVVDVQGSDNYCRVTFAVQAFGGAIETQAFMKKDAKFIPDSAHYIIIDKDDKDRCTVL